ncbi:hypothetical protein [Streptococcus fryi]
MTKYFKNKVSAETIVGNLKEFVLELHQTAKDVMIDSLIEKDEQTFVSAKLIHDLSHGLTDIVKGKSAAAALERVFGVDEDDEDGSFVGQIAVDIKTGQVDGIEDITDPELKKQLAEVISKLSEKLGGE